MAVGVRFGAVASIGNGAKFFGRLVKACAALGLAAALADCSNGLGSDESPVIDFINPTRVPAGSVRFTPYVYGSAFSPDAKAIVNGQSRPINFFDPSSLQVILADEDVAHAGSVEIAIDNGSAGGSSNRVTLEVVNEPSRIFSVSPTEITVGSAAAIDSILGRGFNAQTVVRVNGQDRPTTFGDDVTLIVHLSAADIAQPGVLRITAFTPAPGGGTSNEVLLSVVAAQQVTGIVTLPIRGERVIADPTRSRLYLSVIPDNPSDPGSVAAIDPGTGAVVASYPVSTGPGRMAISPGGRFLFVASQTAPAIDRIDLVNGTVLPISLLVGSPTDQPTALDLVPLVNASGSVLATINQSAAPNTPGLIVFDGATARARTTTISMSKIEPSLVANIVYGQLGTSFYRLVVNSEGVEVGTEIPSLTDVAISDIQQVGGKVYASNGGIYDLDVGRVAGRFSDGQGDFYVDGPRNRVFFVQGNVYQVWAVDLATSASLGTVHVVAGGGLRGNLTSFGTDGIALFTDDQHLVLFHTTLVSQ